MTEVAERPAMSGPRESDFAAAAATIRAVAPTGRVLLICHLSPDGDALGSMLGFALGLRRLEMPQVQATFPGEFEVPEPFVELPGMDMLVPEHEAYADPDLVIVFDRGQERTLREWAGDEHSGAKVQMLLSFDESSAGAEVPDPYYSDAALFDSVLATIERASVALFRQLEPVLRQGVS